MWLIIIKNIHNIQLKIFLILIKVNNIKEEMIMKIDNQIILTMIVKVIMITMLHEENDKHDKNLS